MVKPAPEPSEKFRAYLFTQAELYEMGADSPSMLPKVQRLARYLATRTLFDLSQLSQNPRTMPGKTASE